MKHKFQAVVSSTIDDLEAYRNKASEILQKFEIQPRGFKIDSFEPSIRSSASTPWPVEESRKLVEEADLYLGIFAWKYGTVAPGENTSLTELEYNLAVELDMPRFLMVIDENCEVWNINQVDPPDSEQAKLLREFKSRIGKLEIITRFDTLNSFAENLEKTLLRWRMETPLNELPAGIGRLIEDNSQNLSGRYANRVRKWFSKRFALMTDFASKPNLMTNDPTVLDKAVVHVFENAEDLSSRAEFRGGVYCLRNDGLVLSHHVPHDPSVDIRMRYNASKRDYFQDSLESKEPLVSNSFKSADREKNIIVVAVPRFDSEKNWLGILDAVVDLPDAPFNDIASEVGGRHRIDNETGKKLELLLLDENARVLGSLNENRRGGSFDGNPNYEATLEKIRLKSAIEKHESDINQKIRENTDVTELKKELKDLKRACRKIEGSASGYGWLELVEGTPFHVVATWVD